MRFKKNNFRSRVQSDRWLLYNICEVTDVLRVSSLSVVQRLAINELGISIKGVGHDKDKELTYVKLKAKINKRIKELE